MDDQRRSRRGTSTFPRVRCGSGRGTPGNPGCLRAQWYYQCCTAGRSQSTVQCTARRKCRANMDRESSQQAWQRCGSRVLCSQRQQCLKKGDGRCRPSQVAQEAVVRERPFQPAFFCGGGLTSWWSIQMLRHQTELHPQSYTDSHQQSSP